MPKKYGWPKDVRIIKNADFKRVFKEGKRISGKAVNCFIFHTNQNIRLFGIVAHKRKIREAVRRNHFKRLVREIIRKKQHQIIPGVEIIFAVLNPPASLKLLDFENEINGLLKNGKVLKPDHKN